LSYRAERYRLHNEAAKRFFTEFSKDPARREAILRERAKVEPVEEGVLGPPEYVYLIPDASSESFAAVKVETE
jgi:hypothetical protein